MESKDERVEITEEHIKIMREKYHCEGLTDNQIIEAMQGFEMQWRTLLGSLCFPDFNAYLFSFKRSLTTWKVTRIGNGEYKPY